MNLKKHLATVLWLGLALVASAMAAPPSPAQDHDGGVVMSFVTGEAQEDGNVSAAPAISDAESQCGSAGAAHWALYRKRSPSGVVAKQRALRYPSATALSRSAASTVWA